MSELRMKHPRILRVDRSPLNPSRWCVKLSCGHERWITSKRRPKQRVTQACPHGCMRDGKTDGAWNGGW